MPNIGIVIGNGLSREGFDLDRLRGHGVTVGCNYLFRDWEPDYLVAMDIDVCMEIQDFLDDGNPHRWRWLTRHYRKQGHLWLMRDGEPLCDLAWLNGGQTNNSGVVAAAYLAEYVQVDVVYLVGIDFFLPVPDRINNVYGKGTTQTREHIRMWNMLPALNTKTLFVRVGPIPDIDRDFYKSAAQGFFYEESFDTVFPIND